MLRVVRVAVNDTYQRIRSHMNALDSIGRHWRAAKGREGSGGRHRHNAVHWTDRWSTKVFIRDQKISREEQWFSFGCAIHVIARKQWINCLNECLIFRRLSVFLSLLNDSQLEELRRPDQCSILSISHNISYSASEWHRKWRQPTHETIASYRLLHMR